MTKVKLHPDASKNIDVYIDGLEEWSKQIAQHLRTIILAVSPHIKEDWKWNLPNYYCNGMICGIWVFKTHVTLVFFQGALIDDIHNVLQSYPDNLHNRHIKYTDIKDIDSETIKAYILQSINNNTNGIKINHIKNKTIEIPYYLKEALGHSGLLESFENMSFSHKKEYILWIKEAKKEDTKIKRVEKTIQMLREKFGLSSL